MEDAPKSQRKGGAERNICVRDDSTQPFQHGPPLNSMAFLRLKSTETKCRERPSSIIFEGHQIILCLGMIYLKCSMHTISPQNHCHQSPKLLRDKYALTMGFSAPFLSIICKSNSCNKRTHRISLGLAPLFSIRYVIVA